MIHLILFFDFFFIKIEVILFFDFLSKSKQSIKLRIKNDEVKRKFRTEKKIQKKSSGESIIAINWMRQIEVAAALGIHSWARVIDTNQRKKTTFSSLSVTVLTPIKGRVHQQVFAVGDRRHYNSLTRNPFKSPPFTL